jgi:protein-S-isoprenylcysteine O-methyltransferase Ste14
LSDEILLDAYRLALIVIFLLSTATAGYYRFQAAKSGETISRQEEGRILFLSIRLAGLLLFVGTLLYLINPRWMAWASVPLPDGIRWSGAALGLCSIPLLYWTLSSLGKNLTDTVAIRANHTLVTRGPYRWVRHPYYVSLLLLVCGTSLLAANWFIGVTGLLVFVLLAIRTSIEERNLVERFGEEYRLYMKRTGHFVPRFW